MDQRRKRQASKQEATIEDVARRAGVSTATVSRAMNAPDRVRAATRERVERAVNDLGYAPHFGGRALASNRSGVVGAVIPTMENAIFARGVQALEDGLAAENVTLLVATSHYEPAREARQIDALLARGVDGLALIGAERDPAIHERLDRRGAPYVLLWSWRDADHPPCIGFDNRAAARRIAERALGLGHRRVAMIAGVADGNDRAAARIAGVRDALAEKGLALDASTLIEARYSLDDGARCARALLRLTPRPTLILCGNDVLAAAACAVARAHGLNVPNDLSVTGFDDIDVARVVDPPLTTMRAPHHEMGAAAAGALLRRVGGGPPIASQLFDCELVERASLSAPPA